MRHTVNQSYVQGKERATRFISLALNCASRGMLPYHNAISP